MDNNIAKVIARNDSNESECREEKKSTKQRRTKMVMEREKNEPEKIYEIKVSSAQSFLIYFVIVLCHGFILIENLYMRLHFENEP